MNEWCECGVMAHPFTPFLWHPDISFYPNSSLPNHGNALFFLFYFILPTPDKYLVKTNILLGNCIQFSISPKLFWEIGT